MHHGVVVGLSVEFFLTLLGEFHDTLNDREDCKITSHFYALSRKPLRAFLADDDVARSDDFTCETLNAASFGLRIATVLCRASGFFMCHRGGGVRSIGTVGSIRI